MYQKEANRQSTVEKLNQDICGIRQIIAREAEQGSLNTQRRAELQEELAHLYRQYADVRIACS